MSTGDARMREFGAAMVVPEFADPAFTSFDRPLAGATVAIVTSAALHRRDADGPVLASYPGVIEADETPMACTIPPRYDPTLPPAVDEARGLRAAYDRALARRGATSVGRTTDAGTVPYMAPGHR